LQIVLNTETKYRLSKLSGVDTEGQYSRMVFVLSGPNSANLLNCKLIS